MGALSIMPFGYTQSVLYNSFKVSSAVPAYELIEADRIFSGKGILPKVMVNSSSPLADKNLVSPCGTVIDTDGNVYHTVKIGKRCWMRENLKTTHYRDGTVITEAESRTSWENATESLAPAWSYYDKNDKNNALYGKLYNWYAVADAHNLCPVGWHVPTDDEFQLLSDYLGNNEVSGGKIKSIILWSEPNTGADNSSGFTALPSGFRTSWGTFEELRNYADIWSCTSNGIDDAWSRNLSHASSSCYHAGNKKGYGFSVRCIEN